MAGAKAKTINLLLYEGNLGGVISIEDSSWNSGELYSAPRDSVNELLDTDACKKYGVYMLISQDMVYIGQASDLARRVTQHLAGKSWWESVVILTTKDDSLTHSDIDYLESVLIGRAKKVGRLDCDNKNKGNNPKVDKFREVYLGQYLDEALFLLQLIGINVFSDSKTVSAGTLIKTLDVKTRLAIGKRAKSDAIKFLLENGVKLESRHTTYAVRQDGKSECWANPQVTLLDEDWDIILNNNLEMELVLLHIPAKTFSVRNESHTGLVVRSDKQDLIDLWIDLETFIERRSGLDFSKFVVSKIKY